MPDHTALARLVVAAAALALAGCDKPKPAAAGPGAGAPPAVTVSAPIQRRLTEWDEYTGRFASAERVEIRPRVNGYLDAVHFEDGQLVKQGDLLFTIDPRPYQAAAAAAEAALGQTRARVVFARSQVDRATELRRTDAIASSTSDQRLQELQVAAAEALGAEATASRARLDVEFTQVRSPITGRISRAIVRPGNLVAGEATLLTTVVSIDPIHFYFDTDQNAYLRYQRLAREGLRPSSREEANPVQVALSDEQGWPHEGRMDFVDNEIDTGTGTIRARAVFPNAGGGFTPGLFGRLRLVGSAEYEATLLPQEAIGTEQGRRFVYVVDADDTARQKEVRLGPVVEGLRIVRSGIEPGDRVVVSGLQRVRPNVKVKPEERPVAEAAARAASAAEGAR